MNNINFPQNPSIGQTYTYGYRTWKFDGLTWRGIEYVKSNDNVQIYTIKKSWGAIGHSIWWQDANGYVGTQTHVKSLITFIAYSDYGYSGYRLTMPSAGVYTSCILGQSSNWVSRDIYTLDCITNDFKLNSPIGVESDFINRTGGTTFYGALRELHEILKTLNPKYLMICANALKRNNASYTSWSSNTAGHTLTDYSNALEWVANRLSWKFINQFQDSGINDDNLNIYTRDGLHPNNDGYERYWRLWYQKFLEI